MELKGGRGPSEAITKLTPDPGLLASALTLNLALSQE